MATVGVLAALVSLFVVLVVQIIDRAIELILRNFAASRLVNYHRAPIIHDSDTWLPYLPRSFLKYHKYPAIFSVIVCTMLLIPFELITELGVNASRKCKPKLENGQVIKSGDVTENFTSNELAGISYLMQSTDFVDGPFDKIQAGIPRNISGFECISCLNGPEHPTIISGCKVKLTKVFKAGELKVTFLTTDRPTKTITTSFNETKKNGRSYKGIGDVTRNGKYGASIMFQTIGDSLIYLEYTDQQHIKDLFHEAIETKKHATGITGSDTRVYSIHCSTNKLSMNHFENAVSMYRIIQLENPIRATPYVEEENRFVEITPEVIYRAVLGMKVIDDESNTSNYYRYTNCGVYNPVYLLPFIVCIAMICILGIVSIYFSRNSKVRGIIPYTSRSWLQHVNQHRQLQSGQSIDSLQLDTDSPDEMVLLEEGEGVWRTHRVAITNRENLPMSPVETPSRDDDMVSDFTQTSPSLSRRGFWKSVTQLMSGSTT